MKTVLLTALLWVVLAALTQQQETAVLKRDKDSGFTVGGNAKSPAKWSYGNEPRKKSKEEGNNFMAAFQSLIEGTIRVMDAMKKMLTHRLSQQLKEKSKRRRYGQPPIFASVRSLRKEKSNSLDDERLFALKDVVRARQSMEKVLEQMFPQKRKEKSKRRRYGQPPNFILGRSLRKEESDSLDNETLSALKDVVRAMQSMEKVLEQIVPEKQNEKSKRGWTYGEPPGRYSHVGKKRDSLEEEDLDLSYRQTAGEGDERGLQSVASGPETDAISTNTLAKHLENAVTDLEKINKNLEQLKSISSNSENITPPPLDRYLVVGKKRGSLDGEDNDFSSRQLDSDVISLNSEERNLPDLNRYIVVGKKRSSLDEEDNDFSSSQSAGDVDRYLHVGKKRNSLEGEDMNLSSREIEEYAMIKKTDSKNESEYESSPPPQPQVSLENACRQFLLFVKLTDGIIPLQFIQTMNENQEVVNEKLQMNKFTRARNLYQLCLDQVGLEE